MRSRTTSPSLVGVMVVSRIAGTFVFSIHIVARQLQPQKFANPSGIALKMISEENIFSRESSQFLRKPHKITTPRTELRRKDPDAGAVTELVDLVE
jgi:hypothetical protein